jgi:hypothetical protein
MDEARFEALLKEELTPLEGPADRIFLARIGHAVVEAELYRRARRRILGQLGTEALAVGALAASLAFVARIPEIREALTRTPELAWPAILLLLLFWMLLRGKPGALA